MNFNPGGSVNTSCIYIIVEIRCAGREHDIVGDLKSLILLEAVHVRTFPLTNSSNLSLKTKMGGLEECIFFFFSFCTCVTETG